VLSCLSTKNGIILPFPKTGGKMLLKRHVFIFLIDGGRC
jgi:hypothetical protein